MILSHRLLREKVLVEGFGHPMLALFGDESVPLGARCAVAGVVMFFGARLKRDTNCIAFVRGAIHVGSRN